jgi:hypothetical protein
MKIIPHLYSSNKTFNRGLWNWLYPYDWDVYHDRYGWSMDDFGFTTRVETETRASPFGRYHKVVPPSYKFVYNPH